MANFKPQVTYMTNDSLREYRNDYSNKKSKYIYERYKTYAELKKNLRRILEQHIGDEPVFVSRSRRGEWGEWAERWVLINGKPTIVKQGWM